MDQQYYIYLLLISNYQLLNARDKNKFNSLQITTILRIENNNKL